jgi:hypothetical protein
MARLNLVLIPNFWLPRKHECGPAGTGSVQMQLSGPKTESATAQERADEWSESVVEYTCAVEPAAQT